MNTKNINAPLNHAHGGPLCAAEFKTQAADFRVDEVLGFEADGDGHHWLVNVEKNNINTLDLLDQMAKQLRIARRSMGYSGLKDRHAVTRQWVTVPSQGVNIDALLALQQDEWRVQSAQRHQKKLRVGSHHANRFTITLRNVAANTSVTKLIEARLAVVGREGVPNYFGPQRFGVDGSNLSKALQLFDQGKRLARQQHRFAVSAARSMLFNWVVSQRVQRDCWQRFIDGDAVALAGSRSWFTLEKLGEEGAKRLAEHDVHPSGPLWGAGAVPTEGMAAELEQSVAALLPNIAKGLGGLGLKQERRATRLSVTNLEYQWLRDTNHLQLGFELPKGGFATSVLRELFCNRQFEFYWPQSLVSQFANNT